MNNDYKICPSCEESFPKAEYQRLSGSKDNYCKACRKRINRLSVLRKKEQKKASQVEEWKKEISLNIYLCKMCKKNKSGKEMQLNVKRRQVNSYCKSCGSEKWKKNQLKRLRNQTYFKK